MEHENFNTEETANSDLGAVSGSFDYGFIEWIGKYHLKIIRVGGTTIWNSGSKYWKFDSIDEMYEYYLKNYR